MKRVRNGTLFRALLRRLHSLVGRDDRRRREARISYALGDVMVHDAAGDYAGMLAAFSALVDELEGDRALAWSYRLTLENAIRGLGLYAERAAIERHGTERVALALQSRARSVQACLVNVANEPYA